MSLFQVNSSEATIASQFSSAVGRSTRALRIIEGNMRIRAPKFLSFSKRTEPGIVVALTSFPGRIDTVWCSLESIFRQTVRPEEVILILSRDEFPNGILPRRVMKFTAQGLKVIFDPGNIRSYKKLLPLLPAFSDKVIITADDDVIYPRNWLSDLILAHKERPDYVLGHRGAAMKIVGSTIAPYNSWPRADERTPSHLVFLTGMGGILYPPNSLPKLARDAKLAMQLCPNGDDIWFKAMTLLNTTPVAKIGSTDGNFPVVRSAQVSALHHRNVAAGQNDLQLQAVFDYFDLLSYLPERTLK